MAVGFFPVSLNQSERETLSFSGQFDGVWLGEPQQWHLNDVDFVCARLDSDFFLSLVGLDFDLLEEEDEEDLAEPFVLDLELLSNFQLPSMLIAFSKVFGYSSRPRAKDA